ncbi:MAG: GNAT family N-acetyltransferase [Ktedonobacteraceae bacterium]|nr:GNAT family N-acetyltransferase [Ktedonobacteraceae bacterium]
MTPIPFPYVPSLSEGTFRHLHGPEDAPASVSLIEACRDIDAIDPLSTREKIPTVKEMRADCADRDPQNVLFALHGDEMIASIRLSWWTEADGTRLYLHLGRVVPQWRGRGLGTAMLRWAEERIRALANEHPTNGKGVLGANASSTEKTATELLLNEGYWCVHVNAQMDFTDFRKLTEPHLPVKIERRSVRPDQIRLIWEAIAHFWAGTSRGTPVPSEEEYQEFLHQPDLDQTLWQVAWDQDQPVGMVLGRVSKGCGYIDEVSVDRRYRRQGIAQALMWYVLTALRERDVQRVRLHTDANNRHGARSLYEKMGFSVVKEFPRYRKPL